MLKSIFNFFKPRDIAKANVEKKSDEKKETNNETQNKLPQQKKQLFKWAETHIELEINIVDAIIEKIKVLRFNESKIKELTIYLNLNETKDAAIQEQILTSYSFENKLRSEIDNAQINFIQNWEYSYSKEMNNDVVTNMGFGIYYGLQNTNSSKVTKAKITAMQGELIKTEIILDNIKSKYYNIGRGEKQRLDNGMQRINQIAIKDTADFDDADDINLKHNKYVSRAHACINYSPIAGFELKVQEGGCYISGNRTKIFRGNSITLEIDNTAISYPLLHGDQIELGKNVILLFELID